MMREKGGRRSRSSFSSPSPTKVSWEGWEGGKGLSCGWYGGTGWIEREL